MLDLFCLQNRLTGCRRFSQLNRNWLNIREQPLDRQTFGTCPCPIDVHPQHVHSQQSAGFGSLHGIGKLVRELM